eukprot:scaffold10679_cov34-Phaeocystis_antarctica.AAC.1
MDEADQAAGCTAAKLDVSGRSFGAGPGPMVDKNLAYTNSEPRDTAGNLAIVSPKSSESTG